MKKTLTERNLKSIHYQDLDLDALDRGLKRGEIDQAEYRRRLDVLLTPFSRTDPKTGRVAWSFFAVFDDHRDSPRGFGLRVFPSGERRFIYTYRVNGRKRILTLGSPGELVQDIDTDKKVYTEKRVDLTLATARKHATFYKTLTDPIEFKRQNLDRKPGNGDVLILAQLCTEFLENHAKQYKRESSWKEDERRLKRYVIGADDAKQKERPAIGKRVAETVTEAQIDSLAQEIGKRAPIESNRVVVLLATVYAWAIRKGKLPGTFANPAQRSKKDLYPEQARARILKTDERPKLLAAIDAEPNAYHRGLFRLLLLTGLRKSELLNAKHKDLDLGEKTLHLPKTKSGKPRTIPLSGEAVQIIRKLPRCVGNDHIFPAHRVEYQLDRDTGERNFQMFFRSGNQPMSNPKKQWRRVRHAAGCDDLRIHDLRRTASVMVIRATGNPRAAMKVLGHADLGTTLKHYASVTDEETRDAVEALSHALNGES